MQIASKYLKKLLTVTNDQEKCQLKQQWDTISAHYVGKGKIWNERVGDVGKLGPSYIAGENIN